jgi:competence ComEA-like helix-hairpin-helix protein
MGGTKSCFPSPSDSIHTLRRRRHLVTKIKTDQTGSTTIPRNTNHNNNNNNTINLNHASEDELLMLPGITRQIAQNILQYRQLNHGFKQINELLLITGINHDLFERIRSDISIDLSSENLSNNKQELININLATYEQLCSIPNLTPILATRIIQRRERKGLFRFIEDLLKIKGIDYIVLANIRSYITVDSRQLPLSVSESSIPNPSINNLYPTLNKNNNNITVTSDSLSLASLLLETLPPELQTILLSSSPQRPSPIPKTNQTYFRFASWNLQQLTNDKVQNPGVREVICRIILENK